MVSVPKISSCCCCTLKTGVLVIGWLTIVGCSLSLLSGIREIINLPLVEETVEKELGDNCDENCKETIKALTYTAVIGSLICNLISLVIGSLMVYGVNKNKPKFLTPFLIESAFELFFLFIGFIVLMVFFASVPVAAFLIFVVFGLIAALIIYFALVVKNYQMEMMETEAMNRIPLGEEETGGFSRFA